MQKLASSNEIMSAILTADLSAVDIKDLTADPKAFIMANTGVAISDDVSVAAVENNEDTVHLALPYYEMLGKINAQAINEDDLEATVGGEIFISIGCAIGASVGLVVGVGVFGIGSVTGGLGASIGVVAAGSIIGGVIGAGAAAGTVAGAVEGTREQRGK